MEKVYFVFKNMKEATYYFRNIVYELGENNKNIKCETNEKKIIISKTKENLIKKLFKRFRKMQEINENRIIEVNFRSVKSNLDGVESQNIFTFLKDEYDIKLLVKLMNKL